MVNFFIFIIIIKQKSSKRFGIPNNLMKTFKSNAFLQSKLHNRDKMEISQRGLDKDF